MAKLSQVLATLEAERERVRQDLQNLGRAIAALEGLGTTRKQGRGKLSAAARKKIAAAQRVRWAKPKSRGRAKRSTARVAFRRAGRKNGGSWGGPLARKD